MKVEWGSLVSLDYDMLLDSGEQIDSSAVNGPLRIRVGEWETSTWKMACSSGSRPVAEARQSAGSTGSRTTGWRWTSTTRWPGSPSRFLSGS